MRNSKSKRSFCGEYEIPCIHTWKNCIQTRKSYWKWQVNDYPIKKLKFLPPKQLQDEFALYVSDCDKLQFGVQKYIKIPHWSKLIL